MAGLIGIGRSESGHALQGLGEAAQLEEGRYRANQTLKANAQAAHTSNVASMTGSGAAIGTAIMPGIGTAIGAAAGFLAGELFG